MHKTQQRANKDNVAALFESENVAVIGSIKGSWFGGYVVISQLKKFGYKGDIYPVNPAGGEVLGIKAYKTLADIPEPVDLAIIMTSYKAFPKIIEECSEKGIKACIIISDGFAERAEEGSKLQQKIVKIAKKTGMRLIGPNTIGLVNTANGLMSNPYILEYDKIYKGSIGIFGQTGLVGPQALPLEDTGYGISKICDVGNKCDVDENDILEYFGDDTDTDVIIMHIEDIKNGRLFVETAGKIVAKKPVLVLKPGKTKESAKALASHTGSLAGEDRIYDAAMKQAGVIRVNSHVELMEYAKIFSHNPVLPLKNRVAIVTFTGGFGVMGIDAAVEAGLTLADLSAESRKKLRDLYPALASNPTDLGPAMPVTADFDLLYRQVLDIIANDPNVDCIAIVTYVGMGLGSTDIFTDLRKKTTKPIAIWLYSQKPKEMFDFARELDISGVPVFSKWEHALGALGAMYKYSLIKKKFAGIRHKDSP